ncbi:MAG: VOC family protein [Desulfovibrio aminophilus]|jgi:catechol 2,3-dioxygenase-like lactoylglutathione lyase family enzyme|uniref:VOC family protein n=1 Tax=Desulfovibrio aminophilus TaxID=81425 RepID=UPI0039EB90F0
MPSFTGINHLAMATGDMDATIRFWRDLLGMRLVAGLGHPGYRHYFFEIAPQDMIAFFEWPKVEPGPLKDHGAPVAGPHTFDHVSFGVESDDDLWKLKDTLEAAGFWASEIIDHGFIHSLYSFDPNNIAIEFSAPVAAVDAREHPVNTDTAPSPAAQEGPEPQSGHWPPPTPTPAADRAVYPGEGQAIVEALKKRGKI